MENIIIESVRQDRQTLHVVKPEASKRLGVPDLVHYLQENKESVNTLLLESGAILFRNFDVADKDQFLQVKAVFAGAAHFDYVDGNSPRIKLSGDVYTSTEYPKEYRISLHNELSYSNRWPALIFFYCKTPADEGGETPIMDCRKFLEKLEPGMIDKFERLGVKYTRYLSGVKGMGKSWMDTFETTDRQVVEKYCQDNDIAYFWEGNNIHLSQLGAGVATHAVTQEKVWFNQANQFHPSSLPADVSKMLKILHAKNKHKFPQYAFFGNGEEIPEAFLQQITDIQFDCALKFKWQQGDVLMLDNMLMAHGRMAFKGERKIYVSMC
jgi:alpha-ketoglutarate-dependent taurine dioxygenase